MLRELGKLEKEIFVEVRGRGDEGEGSKVEREQKGKGRYSTRVSGEG